jgi:hypothetical protein
MLRAALFHDLGKLDPAIVTDHPKIKGEKQYIGHEDSSANLWMKWSNTHEVDQEEQLFIWSIIKLHMRPHSLPDKPKKGSVQKILNASKGITDNKELIEHLFFHAICDELGKTNRPDIEHREKRLLYIGEQLQ